MAVLKKQDDTTLTDVTRINEYLSSIGVVLSEWPLPDNPELKLLLDKHQLNEDEKQQVLAALNGRFVEQQKQYGYKTQDLVSLHPEVPGLDEMIAKFDRIHTHSDDEVRYIIDGRGVFGFAFKNGEQCLLTVEAEEYIRIPANTEHWFFLDENKYIKAVRYFITPEGWVATYTEKEVSIAP